MSFEYFMKYKNKHLAYGGGELDIEYHTDDYKTLAKSYKRAYQLSKQYVGGNPPPKKVAAGAKKKVAAGAKKDEGGVNLKSIAGDQKVINALKAVTEAAKVAGPQMTAVSSSVKAAVESGSKPDGFEKVITELDKLKTAVAEASKKATEAADKKTKEAADKNKKEIADINKFIKEVKSAAATCKGCDKYKDGKKYDLAVKVLSDVGKLQNVN